MSLTFDGHDLTSLFICGSPQVSVLNSQPDLREVGGRNGAAFVGMTYGTATVALTIAATGGAATRRANVSTLGQWLMVTAPKALVLPDTSDRHYLAVPSGPIDLQRLIDGEVGVLTFELTDPVAYGETKTASLASGGSASITVGGTAPTYLDVTASSAVRDGTSLVWGVRVDGGDFLHVATGSGSARKVEMYSAARVCEVADAITLPTLDSDWLVLAPGTHTVAMDYGTGAATLTWVERWY
jgi:predicted phage tail component-like protein